MQGCSVPGAILAGVGNAASGTLGAIEGTQSTAQLSDYPSTIAAARHAIADMGLTITEDTGDGERHTIKFADDHNGKGGVRIIRLTDSLVRLQVQVGAFGDRELGQLVLARTRHMLGYGDPANPAVAHAPRQRRFQGTPSGVRHASYERRVLR